MFAARLAAQPMRTNAPNTLQPQSTLSTPMRWAHNQSRKSTEAAKEQQKQTNPGELPGFSFTDLGATPTVKAVVYVMAGIIGTAETITYGQWAYHRWWKPAVEGQSDE